MTDKTNILPLGRRRLFAGAGAVGALASAAAVLPGLHPTEPVAADTERKPAPDAGGGYQLTDHVKRYYQTAKV
jgi:hypothetical protein